MHLAPETQAEGYRLLSLDVTGSTNEDALQAAREGDPGGLWVVAREQRTGRGRHGRHWSSPPGNLYASLLLLDPCEPAVAPQLGFIAGLALHEAIQTVTGTGIPRLALKWPNDLLLDGAKASGLLLEGHRIGPAGALALVIGFGVNVATAPLGTPYSTSALQSLRPDLTCETLFPALAYAFARSFATWRDSRHLHSPDAFGSVRRRWLERAAGIGTEVAIRLPAGERRGVFEGLDALGRLELRTGTRMELIDAGDLYFPALQPETAELSAGPEGS